MSYILDALRKSDQQRRRGAAPTLQSASFMAARPEPRSRALFGVLALGAAAAAFAIGWARPWHSEPPVAPVSLKPSTAMAVLAPAPAPSPAAVSRMEEATAHQPATLAPHVEPRPLAVARPSPAVIARRASAASATPAPAGSPETGQTSPAAAPVEEKVLSFAELPAAVRQELPQMSVSVHAYSRTPKDRLVGINDKLLREGDALAPGLVLQSITPDGMVFSYKGLRFQRGVQ